MRTHSLWRWASTLTGAVLSIAVSGCFSSRAPLIGPAESLKMFGDAGRAKRVSYSAMGGGPIAEAIAFTWLENGYVITDARGRREPLHYRLTPLKGEWFVTQRAEPGGVDYGLARRIGDQLYVYAPQCLDFNDADRAALGLRVTPEGTCLIQSGAQLRAAMSLVAARNPQPEGYYEMVVPTRP